MFVLILLQNVLIIYLVGCSGNLGNDYALQANDDSLEGIKTADHQYYLICIQISFLTSQYPVMTNSNDK